MAVAATGFFDGVHLGHRAVTETLLRTARERGEQSLVVTFWPHPRVVLGKDPRELRLLSSLDEKIALLRSLGADRVEVVPFTREFASMSAREYLEMLRRDYEVTAIVLGYDNRFGSDALSTEQIAALANEMGVQVQIVSQCTAVLQKGEDSPQENCATLGTIRGGTVSEANGGVERSETVSGTTTSNTQAPGAGKKIVSPLPGVIIDVCVNVGDAVKRGQKIAVIEAMKMENDILAESDGTVTAIYVKKTDSVLEGADIASIA